MKVNHNEKVLYQFVTASLWFKKLLVFFCALAIKIKLLKQITAQLQI